MMKMRALGRSGIEVALAWVMARPGVTAPIASATNAAQLEALTAASAGGVVRA